MTTNGVPVPPERVRAAEAVAAVLTPGRRVVLTTHVNADGDGVGSEVALWHLLTARGLRATIANPTPIPERFHFLLPEGADHSDRAAREIAEADVVVVLDISEVSRLGDLARAITQSQAVACIDHHVSVGSLPGGPRLVAPEAAATAELVFDFASALQWPLCPEAARALYVGILTDTGGFRFANTTPRVLRVAGALLERGVDPESIYASVYASAPEGRVRLRTGTRAGGGTGVSQRALVVRRNARTKFRLEKSPPVHTRHNRSLPGRARAIAASLHPRPCSSWIRPPKSTRKSSLSRSRAAPCSTRPRCWQNSTRGSSARTRRSESIIA